MLITPEIPKALLFLQADQSKTLPGTDTIKLIKSGSNSDCYNNLPTIMLNIYKSTVVNPVTLLTQIITINPISAFVKFTCDQTSTLYYLIALNQSLQRNVTYIKSKALLMRDYNISDPYQEQYGFVNMIEKINTLTQTLEITNLFPNISYNLSSFCESTLAIKTAPNNQNFQTGDNNGKFYKITATYSISLGSSLVISLGCFFNKLYKIPARK